MIIEGRIEGSKATTTNFKIHSCSMLELEYPQLRYYSHENNSGLTALPGVGNLEISCLLCELSGPLCFYHVALYSFKHP